METAVRIAVFCVTASLLFVVVRRGAPEIAAVLTLAAVAAVLLALGEPAQTLWELLISLRESSGLDKAWFTPLYKSLGIALAVRIGGDLCRDAGAEALAGAVETAGTVCAMAVAAPLLETVLNLIVELRP